MLTAWAWLVAWLLSGRRAGMLRPWAVVCLRIGARRLGLRWRPLAPLGLSLALDLAVAIIRHNTLNDPGRWTYALACGGALIARSAPGAAIGAWILAALLQAARDGVVALATPALSLITIPLVAERFIRSYSSLFCSSKRA